MEELTVLPKYENLLRHAGLIRFPDFVEFSGGRRICHKQGRSVYRVEIDGRVFYLKRNRFHWVEFWKALRRFRKPDLGSLREWENIRAVQGAGMPTVEPVATGRRIRLGLETASFTLSAEIPQAEPLDLIVQNRTRKGHSLDDCQEWRNLIREVASLARDLHRHGMNHQDFYLNHFFLDVQGDLYLLDLQRLQRRANTPDRYRIKDLSQLNYSALECRVTRTDRARFLLAYLGRARLDFQDRKLIRRIDRKTARIARHDRKLRIRRRLRGELP